MLAPPSAARLDSRASPPAPTLEDAALTGVHLNVSAHGAAHALEAAYTRHSVHSDTYAVVCGEEPGQRLSGSASVQLGRLSLEACGSFDFGSVRESSCSAALDLQRATARVALSEAAGELEALLELARDARGGRRYAASACFASCEPCRLQLRCTERDSRRTAHTRLAVDAAGAVQLRWEQLQSGAEQGPHGAVERCVDVRRSAVGALLLSCAYSLPLRALRSAKLRCASSLGTQAPPEASLKLTTPLLSVAVKQRRLHATSLQVKVQRGPRPSEAKRASWWDPQCTLGWDAEDGPKLELQASDGPSHERSASLTLELLRTRVFAACAFGTLV